MQALTSCECTICPDCFRQHFTIALKEKHITDMVCPACGRPDLTDDAQLLSYFSTLDIQVLQSLGLRVPWALKGALPTRHFHILFPASREPRARCLCAVPQEAD